MPIRLSIDRFEGPRKQTAVLVSDDGQQLNVPKALLPKGARAGSVLAVTIELDEVATSEVAEKTRQVQEESKKTDPGGDIQL